MAEATAPLPHWMKALAGLAALALAANAAMVWMSQRGRRDLVRPDYYAAGLAEDARIARRSAAGAYRIGMSASHGGWKVEMSRRPHFAPSETEGRLEGSRCRLTFRRPEDGRLDRSLDLAWVDGPESAWNWKGADPGLAPGRYDVTAEWESRGEVFMESAFAWVHHE